MPRLNRSVLVVTMALAGCSEHEGGRGQAGLGQTVVPIVDYLAYRDGTDRFRIVFSDRVLDATTRAKILSDPHAMTSLSAGHFVEMLVHASKGADVEQLQAESTQVTFWNFSEFPLAVAWSRSEDEDASPFPTLKGNVAEGGWISGVARGTDLVQVEGRSSSVLWNVEFQASLN